jgi:hypothetical protein
VARRAGRRDAADPVREPAVTYPAAMDRLETALARFDDANREDPHGKELDYGRQMSRWIERLVPGASEALRLAARAQHVRRWTIPRDRYPMDGAGYKRWRATLMRFHADEAGAILRDVGYGDDVIARAQALIRKERLRTDAEAQAIEDAACLVFLETQLAEFAGKHEREKVIDIIQKTWAKMSPRGRDEALALPLAEGARALVEEALGRPRPAT